MSARSSRYEGTSASRCTVSIGALALLLAGLLGGAAPAEAEFWAPREVAVDQATSIVFDQTPPEPGVIKEPDPANTLPLELSYAHESYGGGSPVETVRLWVRKGEGGAWRETRLSATEPAGQFVLADLPADGRYYVALQTKDKAGNGSPEPRGTDHPIAVYDTTPPVISLRGDAEFTLFVGEAFHDPGATAHDELDGDLTDQIEVTNPVDTSVPGAYEVRYNIRDSAGNRAPEAIRTVEVEERKAGAVEVDVTPSEAEWTVTDSSGEQHEGQGGGLLQDIPAGNATIQFQASDGYETPGNQSGQVEDGGSLTFFAEYEEEFSYRLTGARDVEGKPGETVDVPIRLNQSADVEGYRFEATCDGDLAEFVSVSRGTLTADWDTPVVSSEEGAVTVSASGTALGGNGGDLVTLRLKLKECVQENVEMPVTLTGARLNDGTGTIEPETEDGLVEIRAERFLWGDVTGDDEVTADDANYLLQYRTGRIGQLPITEQAGDPADIGGANVSGAESPVLGAMDAALILRYVQGIIDRFPVDLDGDGYGPDDASNSLESSLVDRMIAYLDETGARTLRVSDAAALTPGAEITLPLWIDNATRVFGYYVDLEFDSGPVEFVRAEKGGLTEDNWVAPVVNAEDGRVRLAAAGTVDRSGEGVLAVLTFRVRSSAPEDAVTEFAVREAVLNGGIIPVEVKGAFAAPQLTEIDPARGPLQGGSVVEIHGTNLADVDEVLFGEAPAEWFDVDAAESVITAIVPPGEGKVDVHVSAFGDGDTLANSFEYHEARVRLIPSPGEEVTLGEMLAIPIYMERDNNRSVRSLEFTLNYRPDMFAALPANGVKTLVAESPQTESIEYSMEEPGKLRIQLQPARSRGFDTGHIVTCYLFAKGVDPDRPALLYISEIDATNW